MSIYEMNKRIVYVYNSLKIQEFTDLMDEVVTYSPDKIKELFTSRWYIWNIIRNKDFYKLISTWLINAPSLGNMHFFVLSLVIRTANNDVTRETFVKALFKKRVILTLDTLMYYDSMSEILEKDDLSKISCDPYVQPLIDRIIKLEVDLENFITL